MSLYEPMTKGKRVFWWLFSVASFTFATWAYVDYLITHP